MATAWARQAAAANPSSSALQALLTVSLDQPQIALLQNDILDNGIDIDQVVDLANPYGGDWPGYTELCKSYLRFCRDVDPNSTAESFDLYAQLLTDLQTAFSNSRGQVLQGAVVQIGRATANIAMALDRDPSCQEKIRSSYVASRFLKLFTSSQSDRSDVAQTSKKLIILFEATMLCRLYFYIDQPMNCANVFSNIHTAGIRFSTYSRASRVEYRYYLGRFYLLKQQLARAFQHLSWAHDNCMNQSPNKRRILHYLVPCALLLGKCPSRQLLQIYDSPVYSGLIVPFQVGNWDQYMMHVERHRNVLKQRSLYTVMTARAQVPLLRNLFYRVWVVLGRPTVLHFDQLQAAVELCSGDLLQKTVDQMDLESVAVSLISQGFVRANVYPRMKVLRLRANEPFPALATVNGVSQFGVQSLGKQERWMEE